MWYCKRFFFKAYNNKGFALIIPYIRRLTPSVLGKLHLPSGNVLILYVFFDHRLFLSGSKAAAKQSTDTVTSVVSQAAVVKKPKYAE